MLRQLVLILVSWGLAWGDLPNEDFYECVPGLKMLGVSTPKGDFPVKMGSDPFYIHCHLSPYSDPYKEGVRSDSIVLTKIDRFDPSSVEETLDSEIVNDTTVRYLYQPPNKLTRDYIECKLVDEQKICVQHINVGEVPRKPENFSCLSDNWSSLNCTWDEPLNPVPSNYTLSYVFGGRHLHIVDCPVTRPTSSPSSTSSFYPKHRGQCFLSSKTQPQYRTVSPELQFVMKMSNALAPDLRYEPFPVDHFSIVRPAEAKNLTLYSPNPNQLNVYFKIPPNLQEFPVGIKHRVQLKSEFDGIWQTVKSTAYNVSKADRLVVVQDLIPFGLYTVKVELISGKNNFSTVSQEYVSKPSIQTGRTQPTIPGSSPFTTPGSFEMVELGFNERRVFVYWKQIDARGRNGPEFRYMVTQVMEAGNKVQPLEPLKITDAYAEFSTMPSDREYWVYVASENAKGTSRNTSRVYVPPSRRVRGLEPASTTKIAFPERVYEILWLAPPLVDVVESYTVFWCLAKSGHERPYQCDDKLDWKIVDKNSLSTNVTVPTDQVYQFAVSANTKNYSSGMAWTTCTILHDKVVGRMKVVTISDVEARGMKVSWHLDCLDRAGLITGYQISYCVIETNDPDAECVDSMFIVNAIPGTSQIWLDNLGPWTYYKVAIAMNSRDTINEPSSYVVARTKAAKPQTSVRQLEGRLVDATTVELTWNQPLKPNGEVSKYIVQYEFGKHVKSIEVNGGNSVRISGLFVNSRYEFSVRTCVSHSEYGLCGDVKTSVHVQTGIGVSGKMEMPDTRFINSSHFVVEWPYAFHVGGPLLRYDVKVVSQALNQWHVVAVLPKAKRVTINLHKVTKEADWAPNCENQTVQTNLFNISVRAVTQDPKTHQVFIAPWSKERIVSAACPVGTNTLFISLGAVIAIIIIVVSAPFVWKFIKWRYVTAKIVNDVDKKLTDELNVIIPPKKVKADSYHVALNGGPFLDSSGPDWEEMTERETKPTTDESNDTNNVQMKAESPSSGSKFCKTSSKGSFKNLGNQRRNASGSDTTSGCESGRNYPSDESESLDKSMRQAEPLVSGSSYVAAAPSSAASAGQYVMASTWLQRDNGYSKAMPNDGSVVLRPDFSTVNPNLRLPDPIPTSGKVEPFQGFSLPPSMDETPTLHRSQPLSSGYISVADANRMNCNSYLKAVSPGRGGPGEDEEEEEEDNKTITPLYNCDKHQQVPLIVSPKALQESEPKATQNSLLCQNYQVHNVVGSLNGSMV